MKALLKMFSLSLDLLPPLENSIVFNKEGPFSVVPIPQELEPFFSINLL